MGSYATASVGIQGGFYPGGLTNGGVGAGAPTGKYNLLQNRGKADGIADNALALTNLIAFISSVSPNGGTVYLPSGTYRVSSNVTATSKIAVEFAPGALLLIDAGITVTFGGSIFAAISRIFSGAGVVTFSGASLVGKYPQWWGAIGDGVADDTAAFIACVAAMGVAGVMSACAGTYLLTSVVTLNRWQRIVGDANSTIFLIGHNGDAFLFSDALGPAEEARHPGISHVRYLHATGFTPNAFVANQGVPNLLLFDLSFFDAVCVTAIENRQGFNILIQNCVFNTLTATGQAIWFRQSLANTPYWTIMPAISGSDLTGVIGNGVVYDGASGAIRDTVIEACSGDALTFAKVPFDQRGILHLDNVYFEGNTGYHINDVGAGTGLAFIKLTSCQFFKGGQAASKLNISNRWIMENCTSDSSGVTLFGAGRVRLRGTIGITTIRADIHNPVVIVEGKTGQFSYPALGAFPGLNAIGGYGGGAALIMCTAQDGAGNSTVAELFLVRFGFDGGLSFSVVSCGRVVGTSAVTFAFSLAASGELQVAASSACTANYYVVAQMSNSTIDNFIP